MRGDRRWCRVDRKDRFATPQAALAVAVEGLRCYPCEDCAGYHLTSKPLRGYRDPGPSSGTRTYISGDRPPGGLPLEALARLAAIRADLTRAAGTRGGTG